MTPTFHIATRDKTGHTSTFKVQHEEISTVDQVMSIIKNDLPDVVTVLISIPKEILNAGRQSINGTTG